jgi:uncharacterized membrane protein YhaH (DUF805 family)
MKKAYEIYNNLFTYTGRLDKKRYAGVFLIVLSLLLLNILILWAGLSVDSTDYPIFRTFFELGDGFMFVLFFFANLFFGIAVFISFLHKSVQRLHDFNYSGSWVLVRILTLMTIWYFITLALNHPFMKPISVWMILIAILTMIFELTLLLKKGTEGENDYG